MDKHGENFVIRLIKKSRDNELHDFAEIQRRDGMGEPQRERRRFKRLKFKMKSIVQLDNRTMEVRLLDLSPKGALIDFGNAIRLRKNDRLKLSVSPDDSAILLHFEGEIVHSGDNLARLMFLPISA
jgi:hypothetical protein